MTDSPNAGTPLVLFLREKATNDKSFPYTDVDYHRRFENIDFYLNRKVHPIVNQGAAVQGDGWLTDHGIRHITTVIRRAGDLVINNGSSTLTPYEAFLLLTAIHFHDVGNVFGRDRHEQQITTVMKTMSDDLIGTNGLERRLIRNIAMAHGGYADSDGDNKDTIGRLFWRHPPDSQEPRVQFLAALLRFADELADDHTRTSRFLFKNQLLQTSEIYHIYADRLRHVTVRLDERSVRLQFELDVEHVTTLYQKGPGDKVYLYDEIVRRCLKMHRENIYCNRFMQPYVSIDRIDVDISITKDHYMHIVKSITFSLVQRGYPDRPLTFAEAAPDAAQLTGAGLHSLLDKAST